MPLRINKARQLQKRSSQSGVTPFLTTGSTDFTDSTWAINQIYNSEFFWNGFDERLWIGSLTGVTEIISNSTINNYLTGSTAVPGGVDTNVQFNNGGSFGGDSGFIYQSGGQNVSVGGNSFGVGTLKSFESGLDNQIANSSNAAAIGQENNITQGNNSGIFAGYKNVIIGPVERSFIGGGYQNVLKGNNSSVVGGQGNSATTNYSFASGYYTLSSGEASHTEGTQTLASGQAAHAEGVNTSATTEGSHAEGIVTLASGAYSHAEGYITKASGYISHAEGENTNATATSSHAQNYYTLASGLYSHAEGSTTSATTTASHSEGYQTLASGQYSHAAGDRTISSGYGSSANGQLTKVYGFLNYGIGQNNISSGLTNFVSGKNNTIDNNSNYSSIIGGEYNYISGASYSVILGGSNITANTSSTVYMSKSKIGTNTDYTEFEADGTMVAKGEATTWRDELSDAISLQQTGPGLSRNLSEGTVDYLATSDLNDYMLANIQLNHDRELQSIIMPHIHWFQDESNIPNFLLQYRWQILGGPKVTSWTNIACQRNAFVYTGGTMHQVTGTLSGITAPAGDNISDIVQFRIIRDNDNDSTIFTGTNTYTTTVQTIAFDVHIECDMLGSHALYVK